MVTEKEIIQGGHGTGKTGNLTIDFSRQGKHREFGYNTGKIWTTEGIFPISLKIKYFIVNCPFIDMYPNFFLASLHWVSLHKLSSCSCFSHTFMSGS